MAHIDKSPAPVPLLRYCKECRNLVCHRPWPPQPIRGCDVTLQSPPIPPVQLQIPGRCQSQREPMQSFNMPASRLDCTKILLCHSENPNSGEPSQCVKASQDSYRWRVSASRSFQKLHCSTSFDHIIRANDVKTTNLQHKMRSEHNFSTSAHELV